MAKGGKRLKLAKVLKVLKVLNFSGDEWGRFVAADKRKRAFGSALSPAQAVAAS